MRIIFLIFLATSLQFTSFGQKINYSIPEGYEKDILKEDYKKIVNISIPIITKRYTIDFVKAGAVHLKEGQEMQIFNLDNLILKCIVVQDKSQWSKVIEEHFHKLFSSIDEQKNIDYNNYETIKKYLSIRIYSKETINQRGGTASLVARTDLEGTYSLLMLDLPGAFTPVQRSMFDLWNRDIADVFKVALANINSQVIEKVTKSYEYEGDNIEITTLGNDDYAASYALDLLNNSPELIGEWGCVLAIPNKGIVDLCKVTKERPVDFVKFIKMTKSIIGKSYQEHPQPISDQYFWYYNGKFIKVNVETTANGGINVIAPIGLGTLMTEKK